jgi:hypothetical protein
MKSTSAIIVIALFLFFRHAVAQNFDFVTSKSKVSIFYDTECTLDSIAANLLADDIERISGFRPFASSDIMNAAGNVIIIGSIHSKIIGQFRNKTNLDSLEGKWECYGYRLIKSPTKKIKNALIVSGSDFRGTAYGVFDLSAHIGVSPWYWWADVVPEKRENISIRIEEYTSSPPSVKYRGIFINDEDWGLQLWAAKTFEPEIGDIGPKTYAKVFELLLRLKANLIWPAMHPSTKAFFHYPGNVKTAEDYQIVVGSSHAEPMLRNNVSEWNKKTMGNFNYVTNKDTVYKYWEDRVKESRNVNAIYTIGMRGVHDSHMEGVDDAKQAVPLLERIFEDQRHLLSKYLRQDPATVPQIFTAYKEVLDLYDMGVKLPEDVIIGWPDDNYGYIQRLNNEQEQTRKGGSGVYYHASYWGRPHDYLWLSSTHPSLIREEMLKAYETGASCLWVLNVGDIKPLEYNIQIFMDMAFDPAPFKDSKYTKQHLFHWTNAIFGNEKAAKIQSILWDYYNLAFERKPEFMGWSRTEPTTETTFTEYNHFYFGDEAQRRLDKYNVLEREVKRLRPQINSKNADAFYQLVYYPVVGGSLINKKFLYRDKAYLYAKQNRLSAYEYAQRSKDVYDSIVSETMYFNTQLTNGKWNKMMSMKPRNLPVYREPVLPALAIDSANGWSIAPEGYVTKDSSLIGNTKVLSLPVFDDLHKQQYFVDIFLNKSQIIQWTASVSQDWIQLSKTNGTLSSETGKMETRIWVEVDWTKIGKHVPLKGMIRFTGGGKELAVDVHAIKTDNPGLPSYSGFIENNGMVSIHAKHFSRQTNGVLHQWKQIDGLGYVGSVLQVLPLTVKNKVSIDANFIEKNHSFVEYDFYTFSSALPFVYIFSLPTHPLNNNFSVRYAVSIDDGPLKIVDTRTFGRSEEWKQNVLRNRAERKIEMPLLRPGKHVLKIYCIDPGVILDEIRIDVGGLKKAYTTIPETKIQPYATEH